MNPSTSNKTLLRALQVQTRAIEDLAPLPRNPRKHSKRQIRQIADSIRAFGFTNPVIVDDENRILAGHGRVEAARLLKMTSVPTVSIEHLSEADKRAYILADNRLAELAEWDDDLVKLELELIQSLDSAFDLELTGWSTAELDSLLNGIGSGDDEESEDEVS